MRKKEDDHTAKLVKAMGYVLIGGIFALGICLIILFLFSLGVSSGWLNDRFMIHYTIGGCLIGAFCGATYSVIRTQAMTLIIGFLTSCIQFLLILSIGLLMYSDITLSEHGVGIAASCISGGLLAGFLGGKPKKKRRK